VLAALPQPDVALDSPAPAIKYLHRSLKDGELYLLFNESSEKVARTVTLAGTGKAQTWDAQAGKIQPIADATAAQNGTRLPLTLEGQETRFIVIAR
jgi:hypothetical protein